MSNTLRRCTFKGQPFLFTGKSLEDSGAVCTKEQYENFEESYAHYYPDFGVSRYGEKIGEPSDLVLLDGEDAVEPTNEAFDAALEWFVDRLYR